MGAINEIRNFVPSMMPPPFDRNEFENIIKDLAYNVNLTGRVKLELKLPTETELYRLTIR